MTFTQSRNVPSFGQEIDLSVGRNGEPTVIRLRGEHDLANAGELSRVLAQGIAAGGSGLVVDLSEVEFMGAATVGAIVGARNLLRPLSRDLVLRFPPPAAVRLLDICGLAALIAPPVVEASGLHGALTNARLRGRRTARCGGAGPNGAPSGD